MAGRRGAVQRRPRQQPIAKTDDRRPRGAAGRGDEVTGSILVQLEVQGRDEAPFGQGIDDERRVGHGDAQAGDRGLERLGRTGEIQPGARFWR